jgi:hypothetical protein
LKENKTNMYDPIFESQLELKSLHFLKSVNENPTSNEVKLMAKELMEHIIFDKQKVFSLKISGNYGIALNMILQANLYSHTSQRIVIAYASYWCTTNHLLQNENHFLLIASRGIVLKDNLELFIELYKTNLKRRADGTITASVNLQTAASQIENLYCYDLFKVRNEMNYFEVFVISSNPTIQFYSEGYYEDRHRILSKEIYNTMMKSQ